MPGYSLAMHTDKRVDLNALVASGRQYQFRLRANPTVTREGKRYGLTAEGEQLAWLYRQGERLGFSVLTVERGASERLSVRQNKAGRTIIVQAALFEGRLAATEPDRLREALLGGIGHAKSLGLGLLSLAPTRA
jgi:CRISPR system Cascade subunit CasE